MVALTCRVTEPRKPKQNGFTERILNDPHDRRESTIHEVNVRLWAEQLSIDTELGSDH